ncbi:terminase small subunit [Gordonia Phage JonJames]|nr:terminase small subunit [Gordonia Phage JonJames]
MSTPGPAPQEDRARRNKDPRLQQEDWTALDPSPHEDWDIPEIPDWVPITDRTQQVYDFLMRLPQSRLWNQGEWFWIWMSLPTIEKYFEKPGGEGLKALTGVLNSNLRLTQDELSKARIKWQKAETNEVDSELDEEAAALVTKLADRRSRLTVAPPPTSSE